MDAHNMNWNIAPTDASWTEFPVSVRKSVGANMEELLDVGCKDTMSGHPKTC